MEFFNILKIHKWPGALFRILPKRKFMFHVCNLFCFDLWREQKIFMKFVIVWLWHRHFQVHNSELRVHLHNELAFGYPTSTSTPSNIRNTSAQIDSSNMPFAVLIVTSVPWLRPNGSLFLIWIYVITSQARHEQKGFSIARKFHIIVFAVFENYLHKFPIRFVFSLQL